MNLEAPLTMDNLRDNAPQSFAYRIVQINLTNIKK